MRMLLLKLRLLFAAELFAAEKDRRESVGAAL